MITSEVEAFFGRFQKVIDESHDRCCEEQLRSIYFWVIEYFRVSKRNRFWRSIPLLESDELRCACRDLIQRHEQTIAECFQMVFERACLHGEIEVRNWPGTMYLYIAMIQGVLDGMLLYQESSLDMEDYAEKTWQAYWDGMRADEPGIDFVAAIDTAQMPQRK